MRPIVFAGGMLATMVFAAGCAEEASEQATRSAVETAAKMYEVYEGIYKPVDGPPTATLAHFERLEKGQTYDRAVKIIGADADVITDEQIEASLMRKAKWINADGSELELLFVNTKLLEKNQRGLQ